MCVCAWLSAGVRVCVRVCVSVSIQKCVKRETLGCSEDRRGPPPSHQLIPELKRVPLVFEGEPDPAMAAAIHQDLFAYLRTVKLRQVETASGLQHLRSDLAERASIRSEGAVKQILFRALLFE